MNNHITFIEYIAMNNTPGLQNLLIANGYGKPESLEDLIQNTELFIEETDDGEKQVLNLHPDKNVILRNYSNNISIKKIPYTGETPKKKFEIDLKIVEYLLAGIGIFAIIKFLKN